MALQLGSYHLRIFFKLLILLPKIQSAIGRVFIISGKNNKDFSKKSHFIFVKRTWKVIILIERMQYCRINIALKRNLLNLKLSRNFHFDGKIRKILIFLKNFRNKLSHLEARFDSLFKTKVTPKKSGKLSDSGCHISVHRLLPDVCLPVCGATYFQLSFYKNQ